MNYIIDSLRSSNIIAVYTFLYISNQKNTSNRARCIFSVTSVSARIDTTYWFQCLISSNSLSRDIR